MSTLVTITTDGGTFSEKVNRDPLSWAQNVISNGYVRRTPNPSGATDIAIYPPNRIILVTFTQAPKE